MVVYSSIYDIYKYQFYLLDFLQQQEYKVETISTRYESSRSPGATYDVKTTTTTHQEKNDGVFFENQSDREAGNDRVLHVYGFPSSIQIQEVG